MCSQVCERPIIHLLDTPGVLAPKIANVETGMKLALCGEIVWCTDFQFIAKEQSTLGLIPKTPWYIRYIYMQLNNSLII